MSGERQSEERRRAEAVGGTSDTASTLETRPDQDRERISEASDSTSSAPLKPTRKLDPESLAIRARTPRVIRFRRGVIIGVASATALVLSGVAWLALKPPGLLRGGDVADLSKANPPKPDDALADLPKSYADVPKLGEPLPGDLGRPILSAQQSGTFGNGAGKSADQDNERQEAERKKALESGLLASTGTISGGPANIAQSSAGSPPMPEPSASTQASPQTVQATSDRKVQFAEKLDTRGDANPHDLTASTVNTLAAGSVITASLITGINSDVPGMVVAQVTQNTYDSATGRVLLVPQGARLIGNYDSVVAYGQQRALVVWQRLMLPDGTSLRIDNMPATDPSGQAGLQDKVNYHTGRLIKGIAIATLLGVGTELSISGESDLVRALRESAQTNTARAGDQITQRNLDVQPTITIRPGATIRLLVRQDLVLRPWREGV